MCQFCEAEYLHQKISCSKSEANQWDKDIKERLQYYRHIRTLLIVYLYILCMAQKCHVCIYIYGYRSTIFKVTFTIIEVQRLRLTQSLITFLTKIFSIIKQFLKPVVLESGPKINKKIAYSQLKYVTSLQYDKDIFMCQANF